MTRSTWCITAWCEPPGEFPDPELKTVHVKADDSIAATHKALTVLAEEWINPVAVSVVRIDPPVEQHPGKGVMP